MSEIQSGNTSIDQGVEVFKNLPFENLEFARVDHHRAIRQGFPEVVFGQGKTPEQIQKITKTILDTSGKVVVTRAEPEAYEAVIKSIPSAKYDPMARVITAMSEPNKNLVSGLTVVCAGTSDLPVAMEAAITAEIMGCEVNKIFDVGVAG
ncbi:MAG TPA: 1-(5-phosphoribosyl)-5-amino-4-imidazole-carboxylate carboxylase, partial [Dehalococcoidia bacterium]|nr:1-(5-phosphoribosyl)-5-amino-4-imidazole-carboxylate carboxylase [Dehalococcoidia bacterium]